MKGTTVDSLVSRETEKELRRFQEIVAAANKRMNLVSPSTLDTFWHRHIEDSIQLAALKPHAELWIDIGSGGGLPGIVLAILRKQAESGHVHLIESITKKAVFLSNVVTELQLPATVWNERAERLGSITVPDVVTARAVAPLEKLLGFVFPWASRGSIARLPKGQNFEREIQQSRSVWSFNVVRHESRTDPASAVLEISELRKRSHPAR